MAMILLPVQPMTMQRTTIIVFSSWAFFCSALDAAPHLDGIALAASDSPQAHIGCERSAQHSKGSDSQKPICEPSRPLQGAEEFGDLNHAEEQGFRWQPLEPQDRDLNLWYYPGAPRPLWGY